MRPSERNRPAHNRRGLIDGRDNILYFWIRQENYIFLLRANKLSGLVAHDLSGFIYTQGGAYETNGKVEAISLRLKMKKAQESVVPMRWIWSIAISSASERILFSVVPCVFHTPDKVHRYL